MTILTTIETDETATKHEQIIGRKRFGEEHTTGPDNTNNVGDEEATFPVKVNNND